jgi:hypothetical protein
VRSCRCGGAGPGRLRPLDRVWRILLTRLALLSDKQKTRLEAVFADGEYVAVVVTWWVYQQLTTPTPSPTHVAGRRCSPA